MTNSVSGGGAEKVMKMIANELQKRGMEVSIVAINKSSYEVSEINCSLYEIGRNWNDNAIKTIIAWLKFKNIINKINPKLLILNCDLPEFFGALLPTRSKIIAVEHSQYPWRTRQKFGKIVRNILRFKKVIWVGVSKHLLIWPNSEKPFQVILNPIEELIDFDYKFKKSVNRLVFIGRITWEKNPHLVIRTSKLLNLPALFIGDGVDRENIVKMAAENKVEVEMIAFKENPWQFLKDGDLLLVPSRYEGDGLVVLEALQRSIPLIISDIPEFRRFNLPSHNYAYTVDNFIELVRKNKFQSSKFQVDSTITRRIFSERKLELICDSWIHLIKNQLVN